MAKKSTYFAEDIAAVGKFAVMRHTQGVKRCKFARLHDTREEAMTEAKRLVSLVVEQYGPNPTCFYVVEIIGRAGIIGGALQATF